MFCAATLLLAAGTVTTASAKKKDKKTAQTEVAKPATVKNPLVSRIDSVSYALGVANTNGLKNYAVQRLSVDTAFYADFIAGIRAGAVEHTPKERAFLAGQQIGDQVMNQIFQSVNEDLFKGVTDHHSLNKQAMVEGFITSVAGEEVRTGKTNDAYLNTAMAAIKDEVMQERFGANKQKGIDFLAANKTKDSIQTTASGLQYKVLTMGTGAKPKASDRVKVNYRGTLIDGTEFDSSYKRKEPLTIQADRVIKGWTEALTMMPVGSKWVLYIPQELGYASRESGSIPPFSTLIFEVELLEVVNEAADASAAVKSAVAAKEAKATKATPASEKSKTLPLRKKAITPVKK
ncbi:MAG: FKBP-type peptidyl-prolyl cis-trans isomerase [Bacteroidaceae bacterium]|nr:FKBP-type peptidyl-prolyl cis-trans isomerase [Bacteroidaceae bacterium]